VVRVLEELAETLVFDLRADEMSDHGWACDFFEEELVIGESLGAAAGVMTYEQIRTLLMFFFFGLLLHLLYCLIEIQLTVRHV
jgi:molybdopterin/thiamine biosynthesis adenylyltransferase